MTINAAYRVGTTPVLISDFLVTTEPGNETGIEVPSFPRISEVIDPLTGAPVIGLQRKVARINPKLVVAGSGNGRSVETVLTRLNNFCLVSDSINDLKSYLSTQNEFSGQKRCCLIGHLVNVSVNTFRWESHTKEFSIGIGFVEGSGAALFHEVVPAFNQQASPHPDFVFDRCAEDTLNVTATLYANEIAIGNTLERHFGGGYDVFIFADGEFQRIDEVVYLFYHLEPRSDNTVRVGRAPVYIKNSYFGETGLVASFLTDTAIRRNSKPHQRIALVRPCINTNVADVPNMPISDLPLGASRIAVGFIGKHISGQSEVFTAIVQNKEAEMFKLHLTGETRDSLHEIRFDCPEVIMNNILAAAFQKFTRPT